jgi:hypothetical protein
VFAIIHYFTLSDPNLPLFVAIYDLQDYGASIRPHPYDFPCGGGSDTSTIARRVVGGDKKGNLESEGVKYGRETHGTRRAASVNDRPTLSSERILCKDYDRRVSFEKKE